MNPEDAFHPVFFPSLQRGNQIQVQEIDHTCQEKQQADTTNHIQIGTNAVTEHLIFAEWFHDRFFPINLFQRDKGKSFLPRIYIFHMRIHKTGIRSNPIDFCHIRARWKTIKLGRDTFPMFWYRWREQDIKSNQSLTSRCGQYACHRYILPVTIPKHFSHRIFFAEKFTGKSFHQIGGLRIVQRQRSFHHPIREKLQVTAIHCQYIRLETLVTRQYIIVLHGDRFPYRLDKTRINISTIFLVSVRITA